MMHPVQTKRHKIKRILILCLAAVILCFLSAFLYITTHQIPRRGSLRAITPFFSEVSPTSQQNALAKVYVDKSTYSIQKETHTTPKSGSADIVIRTPDIGALLEKESKTVAESNKKMNASAQLALVMQNVQKDLNGNPAYITTTVNVSLVNDWGIWKVEHSDSLARAMSGGIEDALLALFKAAEVNADR